jgi:hypothetical protein
MRSPRCAHPHCRGVAQLNRLLRRDVKTEAVKKEAVKLAPIEVANIAQLRKDCVAALLPVINTDVRLADPDPFAPIEVLSKGVTLRNPADVPAGKRVTIG